MQNPKNSFKLRIGSTIQLCTYCWKLHR